MNNQYANEAYRGAYQEPDYDYPLMTPEDYRGPCQYPYFPAPDYPPMARAGVDNDFSKGLAIGAGIAVLIAMAWALSKRS